MSTVDMLLEAYLYLGSVPHRRIAMPNDMCIFNLARLCCVFILENISPIVMRMFLSPHLDIMEIFNFCQCNRLKIGSLCGFILHFFNYKWVYAFFCFVSQLFAVFFCEYLIHNLCPFSIRIFICSLYVLWVFWKWTF